MYTLLLAFWIWPLWFSVIVTGALWSRLNRPALFFWIGLFACVLAEFLLISGFLVVTVVPLLDIFGLLFHLLVGGGIYWVLYQRDQRIAP